MCNSVQKRSKLSLLIFRTKKKLTLTQLYERMLYEAVEIEQELRIIETEQEKKSLRLTGASESEDC